MRAANLGAWPRHPVAGTPTWTGPVRPRRSLARSALHPATKQSPPPMLAGQRHPVPRCVQHRAGRPGRRRHRLRPARGRRRRRPEHRRGRLRHHRLPGPVRLARLRRHERRRPRHRRDVRAARKRRRHRQQPPVHHPSALYDVTSGSNGPRPTSAWYTAWTGWDGPTGLGTPNGPSSS